MPEGDTVWLAAERMHAALSGELLQRSDFRVPRYATTDLRGRAVREVVARGKHLLTRLEGGLSLHTHFEMDGSWHLVPAGRAWPRGAGPEWQIRLVLGTEKWTALGYRLPVVDLGRTDDEHRWVGHLGPDVLGADWDLDRAVANLRREPDREIGDALLDQRHLAGPGNIYRTEALFLTGTSPWVTVADVPDLPALVERTRALMVANRGRASQSTTGSTRRGEHHWVAARAGRPCRRCGTRLARAQQGTPGRERITVWCPRCQPGGAPPRIDTIHRPSAPTPRIP